LVLEPSQTSGQKREEFIGMSALNSHVLLHRAQPLDLRLDGNEIRISSGRRVMTFGTHALAVLDAFATPTSVGSALDRLKAKGAEQWMEITSIILQLYEAGILQQEDVARESHLGPGGFGAGAVHVQMLNDVARTSTFIRSIGEVVRPGDIVLDIGTGTGVLAIASARAGAARVYAVEATAIADVAASVIEQSGFADRITVVRAWSSDIEIPELADVFVSELIGHDPLAEQLVAVTADARKRLLKPNARLIPTSLRIYLLPVTIPADELAERTATTDNLSRWRMSYGIDFSPLFQSVLNSPYALFKIRPQDAIHWAVLGEPLLLADISLAATNSYVIDRQVEITIASDGIWNGALIYFEAGLGQQAVISTHPAKAGATNHWRSPVWYFGESHVKAHHPIRLHYQYGEAGGVSQLRLLPDPD